MAVGGQRRVPRGLATLALGVLLGVGVLLAWLRTRPEAGTAGPKRLAVLPFENLGRPEDEYFADGRTDAVRGKLAAVPGLQVIARSSSSNTSRPPRARSRLAVSWGCEYLLTGTVRWEKEGGGASRVRVSPELVQVSTAAASGKRRSRPRSPTCSRCRGNRGSSGRGARRGARRGRARAIRERPTQNLAAYDAFLRGEEAADGFPAGIRWRFGGPATTTSGR